MAHVVLLLVLLLLKSGVRGAIANESAALTAIPATRDGRTAESKREEFRPADTNGSIDCQLAANSEAMRTVTTTAMRKMETMRTTQTASRTRTPW